jgi:hypothetical protein
MTTITKPQVTAVQLNNIADLYYQLRVDFCACVGTKEIESWIFRTECCIDRQVKILDAGVSKRNAKHMERLSTAYDMLQTQINSAHHRLAVLAGR